MALAVPNPVPVPVPLFYLIKMALALALAPTASTLYYFSLSPELPVWSVETMTPVDHSPDLDSDISPVFRLFSHQPLSDEFLKTMFSSMESLTVKDWLAYPEYHLEDNLGDFELDDGLYYINNIEKAASAMEMSVIGAKNVANLIVAKYSLSIHFNNEQWRTEL